ncbi:hypothetical protein V8E54_000895, partial [Elaphomyces granulatus]
MVEEEEGDDFVEIDDMLLDELDLATATVELAITATATAATTVTMTATATAATTCCDGRCDCSYDSTTKARPPEGLKG